MFAYCNNNAVMMVDYDGKKPGDIFDSADFAALDFALTYNEESINAKQEYGSAIYMVFETKAVGVFPLKIKTDFLGYSYTKPNVGKKGNSVLPNLFTTNIIVSTVHTHANYDPKYKNEEFSSDDKFWSNLFRMDSYVATPGGGLFKYNVNTGKANRIYSSLARDSNSPFRYMERNPTRPRNMYYLKGEAIK